MVTESGKGAQWLSSLRKRKGDALSQAAQSMGLSWETVHRLEAREGGARTGTIHAASQYYGVESSAILEWLHDGTLIPMMSEDHDPLLQIILPLWPKYSNLIFTGKKSLELRTRVARGLRRGHLVYVYETAPTSRIVGAFDVGEVRTMPGDGFTDEMIQAACIDGDEWARKYQHLKSLTAIEVLSPRRFVNPPSVYELTGSHAAPQGFMYVRDDSAEGDSK